MKYIYTWDEVPLFVDPPYMALIFGYSESTIRRKVQRGEIKAMRDGKLIRISKEEVMNYARRCGAY